MIKILLAEDNEMNQEVLARRLDRRGYEVITVDDGQKAVAAARLHKPTLILMDLSMPVLDGWEATLQIREDPETHDIPVIALTAHVIKTERERAMECGCNEILTKPFTTDELFAVLDRYLDT